MILMILDQRHMPEVPVHISGNYVGALKTHLSNVANDSATLPEMKRWVRRGGVPSGRAEGENKMLSVLLTCVPEGLTLCPQSLSCYI